MVDLVDRFFVIFRSVLMCWLDKMMCVFLCENFWVSVFLMLDDVLVIYIILFENLFIVFFCFLVNFYLNLVVVEVY